jgi:RND superfamily putative drug exporter
MDTLIVRSVLVTSLTLDVGRHIWCPSSLSCSRVVARAKALTTELAA